MRERGECIRWLEGEREAATANMLERANAKQILCSQL